MTTPMHQESAPQREDVLFKSGVCRAIRGHVRALELDEVLAGRLSHDVPARFLASRRGLSRNPRSLGTSRIFRSVSPSRFFVLMKTPLFTWSDDPRTRRSAGTNSRFLTRIVLPTRTECHLRSTNLPVSTSSTSTVREFWTASALCLP